MFRMISSGMQPSSGTPWRVWETGDMALREDIFWSCVGDEGQVWWRVCGRECVVESVLKLSKVCCRECVVESVLLEDL